MSIDALVFTRTRPELDMRAHDVVNLEYVQITAPRPVEARDWRCIGRAPDPSLGWVIDVNCSNSAYSQLSAFARALARNCGGGLFWCDLTAKTFAVAGAPGPGPEGRSLRFVLAAAQQAAEADDGEWTELVEEAPARPFRLPHVEMWDIGVAQVGDGVAWVRPGPTSMFFVVLEGPRAAVEKMRGGLEQRFDPALLTGVVKLEAASEAPARWIERVQRPVASSGAAMLCVCAATSGELSLAHAGDARGYRVFARKAERLQAAGTKMKVLLGGALVLCSSEVWRALGDDIDGVLVAAVEKHRKPGAEAAARTIVERAAATSAAVVVAYHRAPTRGR